MYMACGGTKCMGIEMGVIVCCVFGDNTCVHRKTVQLHVLCMIFIPCLLQYTCTLWPIYNNLHTTQRYDSSHKELLLTRYTYRFIAWIIVDIGFIIE